MQRQTVPTDTGELYQCTHLFPPQKLPEVWKMCQEDNERRTGEMKPLGIIRHHPQQPTWRRENAKSSAKKNNTPHPFKKTQSNTKKPQIKLRFAFAHHKPRCQSGTRASKSRTGSPNPGANSIVSQQVRTYSKQHLPM